MQGRFLVARLSRGLAAATLLAGLLAANVEAQKRTFYTIVNGDTTYHVVDDSEAVTVIVEFQAEPLARIMSRQPAAFRSVPVESAEMEEEHGRFRTDLGRLLNEYGPGAALGKGSGVGNIHHEYRITLNGVAVTVPRGMLSVLRQLQYVRRVTETQVRRALVEDAKAITGVNSLQARKDLTGRGVVIGILDTGIDYTHPDLGGGEGPGFKVIGGRNFTTDDPEDFMDREGHGTHVAGIAAANGSVRGVAPDAMLRAYKVLDDGGSGGTELIVAGIEQAVADGVDIINMSLGGAGGPDAPDSRAVDNATLAGVLVVVSAGNSGEEYATIGSPGVARLALTVGASSKEDRPAGFSSRGPSNSIYHLKPDVAATGTDIVSLAPGGGTATQSGTSMAAPVVAGAAALLMEEHGTWTPDRLKAVIMNTADPIRGFVWNPVKEENDYADPWTIGAGRLNVDRAADASMLVSPGSVSFGLVDVSVSVWEASQTITIENLLAESATYTITNTTNLVAGAALTIHPSSVTLAPGATREVTVSLAVDNDVVSNIGIPPGYTGRLLVEGPGAASTIPYAFVKSNFLRLTFDESQDVWIGVHDRQEVLTSYWFTCDDEIEYVVPLGSETADFLVVFLDSFHVWVNPDVDLRTASVVHITREETTLKWKLRPVDKQGSPISLLPQVDLYADPIFGLAGTHVGLTEIGFRNETMDLYMGDFGYHATMAFSEWPDGYVVRGVGIAFLPDKREYYEFPFKVAEYPASGEISFDPALMRPIRYEFPTAAGMERLQFEPRLSPDDYVAGNYVSCLSDSYQMLEPPFELTAYVYPRPANYPEGTLGRDQPFFASRFGILDPSKSECENGQGVFERMYLTSARELREDGLLYLKRQLRPHLDYHPDLWFATDADDVVERIGAGAPWWGMRLTTHGAAIEIDAFNGGAFVMPSATIPATDIPYVLRRDGEVVRTGTFDNRSHTAIEAGDGNHRFAAVYDDFVIGDRRGEARAVMTFDRGGSLNTDTPSVERLSFISDGVTTDVLPAGAGNEIELVVNLPRLPVRLTEEQLQAGIAVRYRPADNAAWTELELDYEHLDSGFDRADHLLSGTVPELSPGYYALQVHLVDESGSTHTLTVDPAFRYGAVAGTLEEPGQPVGSNDNSATSSGVAIVSWSVADHASSYQVQAARDEDFIDLAMDAVGVGEPALTVAVTEAGTYYWRVRGVNEAYAGPWSEPLTFETAGSSVAVADGVELPDAFDLHQNYPNPFNPSTTIRYDLPTTSRVRAEVYDVLGRRVALLVDDVRKAGVHTVEWHASGTAASGVYFYRLTAASVTGDSDPFASVRQMLLVK